MGFDDDDDEDEARTLPALVLPLLRSGAAAAAAGGGGGGRIVVKPGLIIGVNIFLLRLFFPPLICVLSLSFLKQNFFSRGERFLCTLTFFLPHKNKSAVLTR
jgi:hypothetical protein